MLHFTRLIIVDQHLRLTPKAKVLGISLIDILKRGQWSGASTWQKHYNKEIVNTRESSETVIFNNVMVSSVAEIGLGYTRLD